MRYSSVHRWIWIGLIIAAALIVLGAWQVAALRIAHSSFDNYAAFRGCQEITSRTPTSGTCTLPSGQSIELVKSNGKWYLQGDLPWACIPGTHWCVGL